MTDDDAARLRALAERARNAESERAAAADRGDIDGFRTANNHRLDFRAAASPDSILALLDALDEARRERDEQKRVIDDAYAALGPDAWWMDPPDGGSPTLAEMVAKANEDGRALYSVKRERDAAMALLKKHGIDYEP